MPVEMSNLKPKRGLFKNPNKGLKKKNFTLAGGNNGAYADRHCKNYTLTELERKQLQQVSNRMWKAYDKKAVKVSEQTDVSQLPRGVEIE